MALTTASAFAGAIAEMFKVYYADKPVVAHIQPTSPLLQMFGLISGTKARALMNNRGYKSPAGQFGRTFICPIKVRRAYGALFRTTSTADLPSFFDEDWAEFEVLPRYLHQNMEFTEEQVERSMGDRQSFIERVEVLFDDQEAELRNKLIAAAYGDGNGVYGRVQAYDAGTLTLTLYSGHVDAGADNYRPGQTGVLWLSDGMPIAWGTAAELGAGGEGSGVITSIDRINSTV